MTPAAVLRRRERSKFVCDELERRAWVRQYAERAALALPAWIPPTPESVRRFMRAFRWLTNTFGAGKDAGSLARVTDDALSTEGTDAPGMAQERCECADTGYDHRCPACAEHRQADGEWRGEAAEGR